MKHADGQMICVCVCVCVCVSGDGDGVRLSVGSAGLSPVCSGSAGLSHHSGPGTQRLPTSRAVKHSGQHCLRDAGSVKDSSCCPPAAPIQPSTKDFTTCTVLHWMNSNTLQILTCFLNLRSIFICSNVDYVFLFFFSQ
ncbi:hypothetical protein cypCar_00046063 [Cyprinus carpio]|nr:hypothetical protein cypCar_00046063 [Cyprinus carpio]